MIERTLDIATGDGAMETFICHPERGGPCPPVLLLMDAPGIREELRDMARRLATVGYFVLLPNLYYRAGRDTIYGPDVLDRNSADYARMRAVRTKMTIPPVMKDVAAMLAFCDGEDAAKRGPAGVHGYCMSGPYALAAAARYPERIAAAASFYGTWLINDAEESPHLNLGKIAGEAYIACAEHDELAPLPMVEELRGLFARAGTRGEIELYPGVHHGFAFPERWCYDKPAAERHWERLIALYRRRLGKRRRRRGGARRAGSAEARRRSAGAAVLVDLHVAPGGAQPRRRQREAAGAAQHVAEDRGRLGAPPGIEIGAHRGAVDAAGFRQHRADPLQVIGARRNPGRGGDRRAFAEQLAGQRGAVVGRGDLADIAAHQAVHPGHRRDHDELFPHVAHHVVAAGRIHFGTGELVGDRPHPAADPAAALAEGDAREAVVVADAAVRRQHRPDIGDAAEHRLGAEGALQPVEMNQAVEQRQDCRRRPDRRADRGDRRVEVVMLGGQQHEVVAAVERIRRHCLDRHGEVAERAGDGEPALPQHRRARRPHEKGDVAPRLRQAAAKIAADGPGAEYQYLHIRSSYRVLRALVIASPRRTSSASVSCSSLDVPMSAVATVVLGASAPADAPGAAGLAGSLPAGAAGTTGSVFFSAPRRSASRRRSPSASRSSFTGATTRSGSSPLPWIVRPAGVRNRDVVSRMAPLPLSGIVVTIALSPKVLVPSSTARWLSCKAPATSSASLAVPPLTSATTGRPLAWSPGVAAMCLVSGGLRDLMTAMSPLSIRSSAVATAASKLPPGLLRRSSTQPSSLPLACARSLSSASATAAPVPESKPAMRT